MPKFIEQTLTLTHGTRLTLLSQHLHHLLLLPCIAWGDVDVWSLQRLKGQTAVLQLHVYAAAPNLVRMVSFPWLLSSFDVGLA